MEQKLKLESELQVDLSLYLPLSLSLSGCVASGIYVLQWNIFTTISGTTRGGRRRGMSTAGDQIVKLLHINLKSSFYVCCHNSHTHPRTQTHTVRHTPVRLKTFFFAPSNAWRIFMCIFSFWFSTLLLCANRNISYNILTQKTEGLPMPAVFVIFRKKCSLFYWNNKQKVIKTLANRQKNTLLNLSGFLALLFVYTDAIYLF